MFQIHSKDCYHPSIRREYILGAPSGFSQCIKCGGVYSQDQIKHARFRCHVANLKSQLVQLFERPWSQFRSLKDQKWDIADWNEDWTAKEIGLSVFFLICHGPWKEVRIATLENEVRDAIGFCFDELLDCYPLSWQKDIANRLRPVWDDPGYFSRHPDAAKNLISKWDRRYKVVDLWLGRHLGIPSFPIDRHIQREFDRVHLNVSYYCNYEAFLVALMELGYDPILLEFEMILRLKNA